MGSVGETVTAVSQRLLADHGGLRSLFRLDVAELARIRGLGDAKVVQVKATQELGRWLATPTPQPFIALASTVTAPARSG